MYLSHFGLREAPFGITPDTEFFFARGSHQDAFNTLLVALRAGEGFIKLTGEVGLGKTTLVRKLLNELGDEFVTAYIPNPYISPKAMQLGLAEDLGFTTNASLTLERITRAINKRLLELAAEGKSAVLFLDEAQALPHDSLEYIRLLTNLETEKAKLLQVVLVGQPELDVRLAERGVRQLRQRITFTCELQPMNYRTMREYVDHRLHVAGHHGGMLFTPAALRLVHDASGGVPRLVNILCHKALMAAYGPGLLRADEREALAAIADTEGVTLPWRQRLRDGLRAYAVPAALALVMSIGLAWLIGGRL